MGIPTPDNEGQRLRTLQLFRILDSATDRTLDGLTRLAATICDVPIALVSLVDESRQWFLSRVGLDAAETPRDQAFCAHAIMDSDLMVVEDAQQDERFADNPLVVGAPRIRFYAGAPLEVSPGLRLGTLCVIDRKPRRLTSDQQEALQILRAAVVTQLELRRAQEDLQAVEKLLPMCAWCRSIRSDDGGTTTWQPLHEYVMESVTVTHGMCPVCRDAMDVM